MKILCPVDSLVPALCGRILRLFTSGPFTHVRPLTAVWSEIWSIIGWSAGVGLIAPHPTPDAIPSMSEANV